MPWARAAMGASRTVPDVAWSTIWSELPETAGKSFCSRFRASEDWVLGSWNLVEKALPAARSTTKNPTSATSHTVRTTLRCRKHHLPRPFTSPPPSRVARHIEGGEGLLVEDQLGGRQVLLQVRERRRSRDEQHRGCLGQQPRQGHLGRGGAEPAGALDDRRRAQHGLVRAERGAEREERHEGHRVGS